VGHLAGVPDNRNSSCVLCVLSRQFRALLCIALLLLSLSACRRAVPPVTDPDRLATDFAAAARAAAGNASPIRIVPAVSQPAVPARVLVTLQDWSRLGALEAAWREAAAKDGVGIEPAGAAPGEATYSVTNANQLLLKLDVFRSEGAPAPSGGAAQGPGPGADGQLAILVDDLGYDAAAARAVLSLPGRVSVAILPNLPESQGIAEEAHRRGIEVLLHLPMQSVAGEEKAEKIELRVGEPAAEVSRVLDEMLATVPGAVGVNNHQGSRATANAALMTALAAALRQRGLFFVDSRTSAASIALDIARRAGVPAAGRNVFLDDDEDPAAIRRQLQHAGRLAREQGSCIAIGHPHTATLSALAEALPEIEARGVRLVSVSAIVNGAAASAVPR